MHSYENKDQNLLNDALPLGLEMALAENLDAMQRFSSMTDGGRSNVVQRAKQVRSKQEMKHLVSELGDGVSFS